MNNSGILIILSGASGVGKGTVVKKLLEKYPNDYALSISATTRSPREGEVDGREYFFKSKEEFEEMIKNGDLLEHADYVEHSYGTPKKWVIDKLKKNINIILEIETNGAFQIKKLMPEAILVFIKAPSMEELKHRLEARGTESPEVIERRLEKAREEIEKAEQYDYIITNDIVEKTADLLHNIVLVNKKLNLGEKTMLHPSYSDLINSVNTGAEDGNEPVVQSRYSIVMAASKRARQIVDGSAPLVDHDATSKPLSIAVDEIYSQKVRILGSDQK